ncbi:hypothetical protein GCM10022207_61080 [Streptomyces lannensis]|uniref:Uncharacterized protein n=1 Tax=Streptomyces lannensis TaxID=766498 RepID=A0ABP7KQS3_9ACTN
MSDTQNQGAGQNSPAPTSPAPQPEPDVVDIYANPALVGSEKRSETNPPDTKARRPQHDVEHP